MLEGLRRPGAPPAVRSGNAVATERPATDPSLRAHPLYQEWRGLLAGLAGRDERQQVMAVNGFINGRIYYGTDDEVWGAADYWATPAELFVRGVGDCEDYAIAKYVSLRECGVPDAKLRLMYVWVASLDSNGGRPQRHMVLGYVPTPGAEPLIMDNNIDEVVPASRRPDLIPVFSFNADTIWVGEIERGDPARFPKWRATLERLRRDGIRL